MHRTTTGTVTYTAWQLSGSIMRGSLHDAERRPVQAVASELSAKYIADHGGIKLEGERPTVLTQFPTASAAVAAILDLHQRVRSEPRLRGLDALTAALYMAESAGTSDDPAAARARQLLESLGRGQIVASLPVQDLLRDRLPDGFRFDDVGTVNLGEPMRRERIFALVGHDVPRAQMRALCLDVPTSNLPVLQTTFFGRYQEIAAIKAALDGSRLVTLTGAAGIGKTRLALHTTHTMLDEIPGSAAFVDLTPLKTARAAAQAILDALQLKRDPGRPALDNLTAGIGDTPVHLLLDNCEHLLPHLPKLVGSLLASCSQLKVLATSREPLRLKSERTIVVPGLEVPPPTEEMTPERLVSYESVRLFIDRADASRAGFLLTDQNAADVAEICHKLDGIPLALELAASKMNLLTPAQLLKRMVGQFALLQDSAVNIDPKHRTLWSALSWSYSSLSPAESALFRRLAVFEDHFTIEAVEGTFAGDPALNGELPIALLAQLLEKSLITVRDRRDGGKEFRLYAAVHEFAHEKLEAAGEHDEASQRHYEWFYSIVQQAADEIEGPNQGYWLDRFDDDYENFRAALVLCLATTKTSRESCNYCFAFLHYWSLKGLQHEGRLFIEESLARFGLDDVPTIVCQHVNAACMAEYEGKMQIALTHLEKAIKLCEDAGYRRGMAGALGNLGVLMEMEGRLAEGKEAIERAAAIWHDQGDEPNFWHVKANLVSLLTMSGEHAKSVEAGEEVLAAIERLGLAGELHVAQQNLAEAYLACGQSDRAEVLLQEAINSHRGVGAEAKIGRLIRPLAQIAMIRGEYGRAAVFLGASSALCEGDGTVERNRTDKAITEELICNVRVALGEDFAECWEHGLEMECDEVASLAVGTERGIPTYRRRID